MNSLIGIESGGSKGSCDTHDGAVKTIFAIGAETHDRRQPTDYQRLGPVVSKRERFYIYENKIGRS